MLRLMVPAILISGALLVSFVLEAEPAKDPDLVVYLRGTGRRGTLADKKI